MFCREVSPKKTIFLFSFFFRHRFDRRKQGLTINRKKVSRKRALSPKRTLSTEPSLAESPPCLDPIPVIDTFMTSSGPSCPPKKKKMTPLSNQCTLRSASLKEKRKMAKRRNLKKRVLFPKEKNQANMEKEMIDIIPNMFENLKEAGYLQEFVALMRLIADKKIPLDNISFLLLMDVARWY